MKVVANALVLLFAFVTLSAQDPVPPVVDPLHRPFDEILDIYVRDGLVYYRALKSERGRFDRYVQSLAETGADTVKGWAPERQLAFWINAYNAITLGSVLDAWPVESITKIRPTLGVLPGNGVWKQKHRVAGHDVSLDDIEHATLRRHFAEPRIHFAVNCAAKSCPPLLPAAFTGRGLEAQLDRVTERFIRSPRYNATGRAKPWALSKIFEWYGEDFTAAAGSVPAYVLRYLPAEQARGVDPAKVRWTARTYDWSLNQP